MDSYSHCVGSDWSRLAVMRPYRTRARNPGFGTKGKTAWNTLSSTQTRAVATHKRRRRSLSSSKRRSMRRVRHAPSCSHKPLSRIFLAIGSWTAQAPAWWSESSGTRSYRCAHSMPPLAVTGLDGHSSSAHRWRFRLMRQVRPEGSALDGGLQTPLPPPATPPTPPAPLPPTRTAPKRVRPQARWTFTNSPKVSRKG